MWLRPTTIAGMVERTVTTSNRFALRRIAGDEPSFAADVLTGLTAVRKTIPPRYFYDNLGSALFEAICELPEYYVGRAEADLLNGHRLEIGAALGHVGRIVELGSGNGRKTRLLLNDLLARRGALEYVPVDVDVSMLQRLGRELLAEHESLTVTALSCDFRRAGRAIRDTTAPDVATAIFFLGSTIGNLDPDDAAAMLRELRGALRPGDSMLIGADLKKDKAVLEAAYDDSLGVTAAFNLNLLRRINRDLAGEFDVREFSHRSFYDSKKERIEMHLVSLREQNVRVGAIGIEASFAEGETIHTENSYKYDDGSMERIVRGAGLEIAQRWTDS